VKEQLISGSEDMTWLREVHLHALPSKYKSALISGNEDWPSRIVVFESANPRYDDPGVTYTPDENGKFTRTHANPMVREIDASAAEKRWAAEAMRMGRFLALHQIEKGNGKRMSQEKAQTFFEKFHGFPHWAAEIASLSYEDTWDRSEHRQMNPLSLTGMKANPLGETILALVGTATLAVLGYFWYKSSVPPTVSNLSVTVQPGPMTVSANGASSVYAVLPPNGSWLTASNNASLVVGSIDPIYIQGPYPATPVALSWYVVPPPGTVGMAGPQTTTLTVNQ
jgi:hypothetical protein